MEQSLCRDFLQRLISDSKTGKWKRRILFLHVSGRYVVNASSEEGRLAVNGMSYHARAGENANSAIIVTVTTRYGSEHPLAGMEFQRKLEERAFRAGGGRIPVQRLEDFCKNQISTSFGNVEPQMKGAYAFGDVHGIFPASAGRIH